MNVETRGRVAAEGLRTATLVDVESGLARLRRTRRRRDVSRVIAACAAVSVLAVGITQASRSDGERGIEPVQTPTPSTVDEQTLQELQRVREQGSPTGYDDRFGSAPAGLDTEVYCAGGEGCDDFPPDLEGATSDFALEITRQGGQSALFDLEGRPWGRYVGDGSILVQDGSDRAPRFRLLKADGTFTPIHVLGGVAPARPGPNVILIQELERARDYQVGPEGPGIRPYLFDAGAGTIQPLDVPSEIKQWGFNVDEFLWGWDDCRVIWQQPDGSFDHHDIDCQGYPYPAIPYESWAQGWADPGRMALAEFDENGNPLVLHASLDYGATWQRVEIEDRNWSGTVEESAAALIDALQQVR